MKIRYPFPLFGHLKRYSHDGVVTGVPFTSSPISATSTVETSPTFPPLPLVGCREKHALLLQQRVPISHDTLAPLHRDQAHIFLLDYFPK